MSDIAEIPARYLALWNERDQAARRAAIGEIFTADCSYTDPLADVGGHAGIDALIAAVQDQFPGFAFSPRGVVDAHHNIARFSWELGPAGAEAPVIGFDVAVLAGDGKISAVYGFIDKAPGA